MARLGLRQDEQILIHGAMAHFGIKEPGV